MIGSYAVWKKIEICKRIHQDTIFTWIIPGAYIPGGCWKLMNTYILSLSVSLCGFLIHGGGVNIWLGSLLLQTLCCEESSACQWKNQCTHSKVWWLCLVFYSWVCWGLLMNLFCIYYFIVECVRSVIEDTWSNIFTMFVCMNISDNWRNTRYLCICCMVFVLFANVLNQCIP